MTSSCGIIVPLSVFSRATISVGALLLCVSCAPGAERMCSVQMAVFADNDVVLDILQRQMVVLGRFQVMVVFLE